MKACVVHGVLPTGMPLNAIDHRYFFEKTTLGASIGSYTCGAAREAVAKGLRLYGGTPREPGGHKSLLGLLRIQTPYSPSVAGFCVKQAVLSLISSRGLSVGLHASSFLEIKHYPGDFPKMEDIGSQPKLFCPMKFEFGGIDGVIISIDRYCKRPRCHLLPLQVTIADARDSSEGLFFSQWSHWINTLALQLKAVDVEYVWIVGSGSSSVRNCITLNQERQGIYFSNPPYTRRTIALRELSSEIYSELRYAQAKRAS